MKLIGSKDLPAARRRAGTDIDTQARMVLARLQAPPTAVIVALMQEAREFCAVYPTAAHAAAQTPPDWPMLAAYAGPGQCLYDVAAEAINHNLIWRRAVAQIERTRLDARRRIAEAPTEDEIHAATRPTWPNV